MQYTISPDRRRLTIQASKTEREELRERDDIQSDYALHEIFERLVSNSELEWINPADTGDLTDAPMLGILDGAQPLANRESFAPHYGTTLAGCYGDPPQAQVCPILERWAFMDYQVRSVLEDLRDKGEAVFVS